MRARFIHQLRCTRAPLLDVLHIRSPGMLVEPISEHAPLSSRQVTADDVLEVLRRLDEARVDWWIDGGWGVDALLGKETRPHDDLDLAVRRAHIERFGVAPPSAPWPGTIHPKRVRARSIPGIS